MFFRSTAVMLVVGFLSFSTAVGQSAERTADGVQYWVHVDPSITTLGMGGSVGLAVEADRHVFSLRAASTDPTFGQETWDVGVLYGRALFVDAFMLSASTGVAMVGGRRYKTLFGDGAGTAMETAIGFPLEGALVWEAAPVLALGIRGFANVNTEQPFGGMGVTVRIGRVR